MFKKLGKIFKATTGFIYIVPGISYFFKYVHPVNISQGFLVALCEGLGAVIILITLLYKEKIKKIANGKASIIVSILAILIIGLIIKFASFTNTHVTATNNSEKILLPGSPKDELFTMVFIAKQYHEEIGSRYGKNEVLKKIDICCKNEMLRTQTMYFFLIISIFLLTIFLFLFLSIKTGNKKVE